MCQKHHQAKDLKKLIIIKNGMLKKIKTYHKKGKPCSSRVKIAERSLGQIKKVLAKI